MNKRSFLKSLGLGGMALTASPLGSTAAVAKKMTPPKISHRVWINPDVNDTEAVLRDRYACFKAAGIGDLFFEADSEKHFRIAKQQGLKAHRWMWTMNQGDKALMEAHPEWYAINRKGASCVNHPPYVGYYRWLCPSKPAVLEHLKKQVAGILSRKEVDGFHLDYIRYCDVILPVNLWSNYGIDQSKELPEYDFCYCDTCRQMYKQQSGNDPLDLEHPDQSPSWRRFRYQRINHVVNTLAAVAHQYKKPISAAVFPTPEIAKRIVRQDWTNWNLDAVMPMIYHGFYRENVQWIGDAVEEGVKGLHGKFPLYAGLFLPDFAGNYNDLNLAVQLAVRNGAAGVSIFGDVNAAVLKVLAANR